MTKFEAYRDIESFREYVLVSHEAARVETYLRSDAGSWSVQFTTEIGDAVRLRSIDIKLPISERYANVTFPPPTAPPRERTAEHSF